MEAISKKPISDQIRILQVTVAVLRSENLLTCGQDVHGYMTATTRLRDHVEKDDLKLRRIGKEGLDAAVTASLVKASRSTSSLFKSENTDLAMQKIKTLKTVQTQDKHLGDLDKKCMELANSARRARVSFNQASGFCTENDGGVLDRESRIYPPATGDYRKRKLEHLTAEADEIAALCKKIKTQEDV